MWSSGWYRLESGGARRGRIPGRNLLEGRGGRWYHRDLPRRERREGGRVPRGEHGAEDDPGRYARETVLDAGSVARRRAAPDAWRLTLQSPLRT